MKVRFMVGTKQLEGIVRHIDLGIQDKQFVRPTVLFYLLVQAADRLYTVDTDSVFVLDEWGESRNREVPSQR